MSDILTVIVTPVTLKFTVCGSEGHDERDGPVCGVCTTHMCDTFLCALVCVFLCLCVCVCVFFCLCLCDCV